MAIKKDIDLALSVLVTVTPKGITFSQCELAELCSCDRATIAKIERSALAKLRGEPAMQAWAGREPCLSKSATTAV